jgi:TolB-like protein/DNA-binding winged helix-turn-helix (wHTH) protein
MIDFGLQHHCLLAATMKQRCRVSLSPCCAGSDPMKYSVGDLTIDTGRQLVSRDGGSIALPKLSFDLLLALVRAAPNVVSLDELMRLVWPGIIVSPETVSQRVKLLRDALGDDPREPRYIAGLRGRGYQVIAAVKELETDPIASAATATVEAPAPPLEKRRNWPLLTVVFAVVAVALGWILLDKLRTPKPIAQDKPVVAAPALPAVSEKSIAVLPFVDMSEKTDQEYFADGMAEEIIDLLAKIPGLKVISRTSSFQFKGKNEDLRAISAQLGVAYILEGSVRKSGDRLRVTAQLIDSKQGTTLMSQTYDRDLSDVLMMQDEIAATLVRAMQIEVSPYNVVVRPTLRNTEAYTLYLQGLHAADRLDRQGLEQAASYYQRALDLDSSFAAAALGLAGAYNNLGHFSFMPPAVAFGQARRAAERALTLDPTLAFAHAVLGDINMAYWDWAGAERELDLARSLAPNDAIILFMAAQQSMIVGRWDDALTQVNASLAQDPLNPSSYSVLNWIQIRRNRLAEAEAAIRRAIEISPTFTWAHFTLGVVLLARGQREAALAEFLKEASDTTRIHGSAIAYFALGRKAESDAALTQTIKSYTKYPFSVAEIYAFRGELGEAMNWLDRAYALKEITLQYVKSDPLLKNLEGDLRYKALLRKMNLPE